MSKENIEKLKEIVGLIEDVARKVYKSKQKGCGAKNAELCELAVKVYMMAKREEEALA
jgi:hypothetical protein